MFLLTVLMTGFLALLSTAAFGHQFTFLALSFVVFNTFFELSQSLYDSFLLSFEETPRRIMTLSSFGWGFGYLGGALFAILFLVLSKLGVSPINALSIFALLYLILSVPSIIGFRRVDNTVRKTFRVAEIFRSVSPVPWRELLIYWVIAESVAAVLYFAPLYMRQELGITTQALGMLFLGAQLLAFPATILMGKLANRVGAIKVIRWCLLIWLCSVLGLYFARSVITVIPVMAAFSLVIGSTQAILRAHYASRIDATKSAEGLGYFAIAQKSASVIAPLIVGVVILTTGLLKPSFLILAIFILFAFFIALKLPESRKNFVQGMKGHTSE